LYLARPRRANWLPKIGCFPHVSHILAMTDASLWRKRR
jgi:hypothetical protein